MIFATIAPAMRAFLLVQSSYSEGLCLYGLPACLPAYLLFTSQQITQGSIWYFCIT